MDMNQNRLPVKVMKWDKSLGLNCWYSQAKHIANYCSMDECISDNAKCDLDVLEARLKHLNRNKWWLEANDKPKLRTFIKIYNKNVRQPIIKRNLTR